MSKIFLNYRREDSASDAGRLYDCLVRHFGSDGVFIDIDQIDLGVDFVEAINEKIGLCQVLLVLIGKQWLTVSDAAGRRLDNPHDFVRLEIAAAVKRHVRIIPVLVEGASMPREEQLPDDLKFLARRNAIELSYTRFHDDVSHLIKGIEQILKPGPDPPPRPHRAPWPQRWIIGGLAATLLAACGVWLAVVGGFWPGARKQEPGRIANAPVTSVDPISAPISSPPTSTVTSSPATVPPATNEPAQKKAPDLPQIPSVLVPTVVNGTIAEARAILQKQGFRVATTPKRSSSASGTVLEQEPVAGRRAPRGTEVHLVIADQLKVPNVTGMTLQRAEESLRSAGFSLGNVRSTLVAGFSGPDKVQSQHPEGDTPVNEPGVITLVIERAGVMLPGLENLPHDQAEATLLKLGLTPHVEYATSRSPAGTVVSQSPMAGVIEKGSTVKLVIATAPPPTATKKKEADSKLPTPSTQSLTIASATCSMIGGRNLHRLQFNGTAAPGQDAAYLVVVVEDADFQTRAEIGRDRSSLSCGGVAQSFVPSAMGNNGCSIPAQSVTTWEYVAFGYAVRGSFDIRAVLNLDTSSSQKNGGRVKRKGSPGYLGIEERTVSCR